MSKSRGMVNVSPRVMAIISGEIGVEELDDEELIKGYTRAVDGTFRGVPPKLVPKALHDRMTRELYQRANNRLKEDMMTAADYIATIISDPTADTKTRMDAAKWVFERLQGKTPEVTLTVTEQRWEQLLNGIQRDAAADDILDAEVVDDGREP